MDTSNNNGNGTVVKKKAFRRAHKKSHLGCANCKQRRIKCNEQLPVCGQCTKSKLSCSYLKLSQQEIDLRMKNIQQKEHERLQQHPNVADPPVISLPPIATATAAPAHPTNSHSNITTKLPPIEHSLPPLNNSLISSTPNPLLNQGFETDLIRSAYMDWMALVMKDAYSYPPLYHAVMAFSLGFMAIKDPHSIKQSNIDIADKHRFIAIHELQEELSKNNVDHMDPLLACSLILSWDVFFQDDNIEHYATLAKGLAAVLEKVHVVTKPTPAAACMTDALFQGIKAVQMPPYDSTFFSELTMKVGSIRRFYENDVMLLHHFDNLYAFMSSVLEFLTNNKVRHYVSSGSGTKYYSPRVMFQFLRRWLQIFPSEALSLREPCLLYIYYHAVTRALDALFPEVRYMFQFGFIGPVDLTGVENLISNTTRNRSDFIYPIKILGFFKERLFLLNRLLIAKDPLERSTDIDKIQEQPIRCFDGAVIAAEHYPSLSNEMTPPALSNSTNSNTTTTASNSSTTSDSGEGAYAQVANSRTMEIFKNYFNDRMEILHNSV